MKYLMLICFLGLSACNATPEEQQADIKKVQLNLPKGCELNFAGKVRVQGSDHPSRIFYVKCNDTISINESHSHAQGKGTVVQNNLIVKP